MANGSPFEPPCRDGPTHKIPLSFCVTCGWIPRDVDAVEESPAVTIAVRMPPVPLLPGELKGKRFKSGPRRRNLTKRLAARDGWECWYCTVALGIESATIDHVVPLAVGGTNTHTNLRLSCGFCNGRKGDGSAERYLASAELEERQRRVAHARELQQS